MPRGGCDSLPVISASEKINAENINVMLKKGCGSKGKLLDDAPPSCNVPCFKIRERGKYTVIFLHETAISRTGNTEEKLL